MPRPAGVPASRARTAQVRSLPEAQVSPVLLDLVNFQVARSPALTARTSVPSALLSVCMHERVISCPLTDRLRLDQCGLCHRRGLMRPKLAELSESSPHGVLFSEARITCSVIPTAIANKADCSAKTDTCLENVRGAAETRAWNLRQWLNADTVSLLRLQC